MWTAPVAFEMPAGETVLKVVDWNATVVEAGPLFVEARVSYAFDNGGTYALTARMVAGEAALRLDEQMDLKAIRKERDWRVVFALTDTDGKFRPDAAWWATPEGRFAKIAAFENAVLAAGFPAPVTDPNKMALFGESVPIGEVTGRLSSEPWQRILLRLPIVTLIF